jgi:diadenosine tetraphosphate (Ap4A) HIT family hydrolase
MDGCIACDLAAGRLPLPGGRIYETRRWIVEHCVGPLGVGTLIVKPKRHIVHVWELDGAEADELGPLLRQITGAVAELLDPDQVYVSLWSHAGARPGHIHWVVQPVGLDGAEKVRGPHLQAAMFDRAEIPPEAEVEAMADQLRTKLA